VKAHLSSRQSHLCLEFFIPLIHVVVKRRVFLLILLIAISPPLYTLRLFPRTEQNVYAWLSK
ncbi:hypothetical protein, partial [Escherichia coli]|uniref:hypothetical protein n=1 Tax=Escherichia coli TaxID=562 RepID=UPI00396C82EF